jgi:transcriptional regulator with PAS, ATPase and Fis domain
MMSGNLIKRGNDFLKYWYEQLKQEGREDLIKKFLPNLSEEFLRNVFDASKNIKVELNENDFLSISNILQNLTEFQSQNITNTEIIWYLESLLNTLEKFFPKIENIELKNFEMMILNLIKFIKVQNNKQNLLEQKIIYLSENKNNILDMVGSTKTISKLIKDIEPILNNNVTVLLQGETGTGKEVTARAIYKNSKYKNGPFIAINCSAIPEDLIEAELFGFKKGSFTDAAKDTIGKVELAENGVLFLDEVNELSPKMQTKLLRVIQEKTIMRIGDSKEIKVDFKLICSTNKDLKLLVEQNKFREDLYYRINVYNVNLPPLKERKEDIYLLANHFLIVRAKEFQKEINGFEEDAMQLILSYSWPGNIRELENIITRAVLKSRNAYIAIKDLDVYFSLDSSTQSLELKEIEKNHILYVLDKNNQNMAKTSKELGITRATLYNKIKDYSNNA